MNKPRIYLPEDEHKVLGRSGDEFDIQQLFEKYPDSLGVLLDPDWIPFIIRKDGKVHTINTTALEVLNRGDRYKRQMELVTKLVKINSLPRNYKRN